MLISPRSGPLALIGMSYNDIRSDRSQQTNTSLLIPPTQLPKHFNVPFAIQHGYFRCVRYLLELSYDPNERDQQLRTPLILCSYVENDRWSLSLAQNLLEKGAKIALEDHARRNAYVSTKNDRFIFVSILECIMPVHYNEYISFNSI